jgi:hypothetical protein
MNIKKSIKKVLAVKKDLEILNEFASKTFYEEKKKSDRESGGSGGGWSKYTDYEIISENKLRINYEYGDYSFGSNWSGHFDVDLPITRKYKLERILKK